VDVTDPAGALSDIAGAVAPATPTPGAGVVAGGIVALVAGLCESLARAAATADSWDGGRGAVAQAHELRRRAQALASENQRAYRLARERLDAPIDPAATGRDGALHAALNHAADVPLRIAQTAADCALLAAVLAHGVDHDQRVDAVGAAELAAGAARAAAALVDINLALLPDDPRREQAAACVKTAVAGCLEAHTAL
jgi:methenyltetrahydrofolate cyclohydrolase